MKKILYLSTTYPALTQTFIYREIEELKKAGYIIQTVSRGKPAPGEISAEALPYLESTFYLNQVSFINLIFSQVKIFFSKPNKLFFILLLIIREREIQNFRDFFRLGYHFLEAGCLYTKFKDEGISHIHAHFLNAPTSIALFLSRLLNIPFSFTMHASNIFVDPLMLKTKMHFCKKAVTISKYNREFLLQKYGLKFSKKIVVIHCGVDVTKFKAKDLPNEGCPVILSVGQFKARKGFPYLLDACCILKDKGIDFRCLIVGDGEQKEFLKQRSDALKVGDKLCFLGKQPQERVIELLKQASIFVLASIVTEEGGREGIPVALMEAMACEIPVISTKTVGIPELINNGREGVLIEQKNPVELSAAIELLLKNREARERMGKKGREKVEKEFNIKNIPDYFYEIFN